MSFRHIALGKLIEPATVKRAGDREYPVLSMTMHGGLVDQEAKFKKRVASTDTSAYKIVNRGQLVVGFPIDEGVLAFQQAYDAAIVSPAYNIWDPSGEVDRNYLQRFLRSTRALHYYRSKLRGTTARRRTLPDEIFLDMVVPVPPLPEQRRIAAMLDQADELRAKRRDALAQLDDLTQSIFLDMFGDPALNPMAWARQTVGELADKYSDGPFGSNLKSSHYVSSGVRVIRLQNIGVGTFIDDDTAYISPEHFAYLRKHECLSGDVLIGTLGDPNLRACIQPRSIPIALNKADCVQFRPDTRKTSAAYICALLNQPSTERMVRGLVLGQTRSRISMGRLRGLQVPVPPLGLQLEFARRVEAVERLKNSHRAHLAELDVLFASLQHRAFRGEL